MTITEMLQQSAILTLLGMAIVFAFLWLMIICVQWVGKLVHTFGLDKDVQPSKNETPKSANRAVTPGITAVITGAVMEYRKEEQDHHE
jgi:oxaloacetate decarboxylase gamma subunit